MKFRIIAVTPLLAALVVVVVGASTASDVVLRAPLDVVRLLAALGCLGAALAFERGERLRVAWMLQAICMTTFLVRDLLLVAAPAASPWIANALVLAGNGCAVGGTFLLARTWRVAQIALPGTAVQHRLVGLLAVTVAVAIAGGSLWVDLRAVAAGSGQGVVDLISRLSDVIELALIAPIVLTALAMRGGLLFWPWVLLTTSLFSWLFYDAAGTLTELFAVAPAHVRVPREVLRTLACAYLGAAGLAQRHVARELR